MSYRTPSQAPNRRNQSRPALDGDAFAPPTKENQISSVFSKSFFLVRLGVIVFWTLGSSIFQYILIQLPGTGKVKFPRVFWSVVSRIFGLRIRVIGKPAGKMLSPQNVKEGQRPVIYVSNHTSWLDILSIGSVLEAVFISKGEVGTWPMIGMVARLGRTIFVSRNRRSTGRELHSMTDRLWSGDNIILFPEGTTSDGAQVLPFMSSFFAIAKPSKREQDNTPKPPPVLIQPVSLVYDELEGLPVGRNQRKLFAWYGDMGFAPHLWALGQWRSMRATLILHPPLNPDDFLSRKELSQATFDAVSQGSIDLRRGLPQQDLTLKAE
ncbi:lysophospholipid acyltransferase family protein [Swingsia samuiensis]|uniref:1-acyl-sn-glycerol-3-phosphate acyltransferase n=1 Tax=Swingsia samuiensis TaxID=1293412 RepID=A0A4Y6ULY0_9PROT|nr:lysophospholipid acyltransferase family protein [Swingsia samuiensis]QDH17678.1 1-acyl-sn-glycerol-3-phosphate acyltransferase [Swingsia samuiensis]